MTQEPQYYLRDDVYFEPLLHNWYAWPYLLSPVTAAMNFTARNLRLMKSFVANAQLHIAASNDPMLVGGDFVNCTAEQIDDVRRLIAEIETTHQDYFELRRAVTELNELLAQQNGMSLESLYEHVPPLLRGYVELMYDMNHHAGFRLIEGLLYRSQLYKRDAQSMLLGLMSRVRQRPFVLSSPRFPDANHLHVRLPFSDPWLDRLMSMRHLPASSSDIAALFDAVHCTGGLTREDLFTTTAPVRRHTPPAQGVRVTYLGHAGLLIETAEVTVLVDPVIPSRDGKHDEQIVSFSELPDVIDFICITHTHMDHTCIETLLQLRERTRRVLVPKSTGCLADPSLKLMLGTLGFDAREMEDMECLPCGTGHLTALPFLGEHADLAIRSKTAWLFEADGKKIFVGADSACLDPALYRHLRGIIGKVDLLFVGMECVGAPMSWLYGALFTTPVPRAINESRRFNGSDFGRAKQLVEIFEPTQVGIYALGMEPWFRYFMGVDYADNAPQIVESDKLLAFCAAQSIHAERLDAKRVWQLA